MPVYLLCLRKCWTQTSVMHILLHAMETSMLGKFPFRLRKVCISIKQSHGKIFIITILSLTCLSRLHCTYSKAATPVCTFWWWRCYLASEPMYAMLTLRKLESGACICCASRWQVKNSMAYLPPACTCCLSLYVNCACSAVWLKKASACSRQIRLRILNLSPTLVDV